MAAFIDCADICAARRQYRVWREIGYSQRSAKRLTQAEFERDPDLVPLLLHWVEKNTNQLSGVKFGRKHWELKK